MHSVTVSRTEGIGCHHDSTLELESEDTRAGHDWLPNDRGGKCQQQKLDFGSEDELGSLYTIREGVRLGRWTLVKRESVKRIIRFVALPRSEY